MIQTQDFLPTTCSCFALRSRDPFPSFASSSSPYNHRLPARGVSYCHNLRILDRIFWSMDIFDRSLPARISPPRPSPLSCRYVVCLSTSRPELSTYAARALLLGPRIARAVRKKGFLTAHEKPPFIVSLTLLSTTGQALPPL